MTDHEKDSVKAFALLRMNNADKNMDLCDSQLSSVVNILKDINNGVLSKSVEIINHAGQDRIMLVRLSGTTVIDYPSESFLIGVLKACTDADKEVEAARKHCRELGLT